MLPPLRRWRSSAVHAVGARARGPPDISSGGGGGSEEAPPGATRGRRGRRWLRRWGAGPA
eukprot:1499327-Pyramimonas_sp.AAC.1